MRPASAVHNLIATIGRCKLQLDELVSAPLAAGLATLVEDERQLGTTVIDMGGGTTGMAVFSEGHLLHTAHLRIGGLHITKDIAQGLSTPLAQAERLKTLYGSAQPSPDDEREMLPISLVGEEEHDVHKIPRSRVISIIVPRLEETFEMVRAQLDAAGIVREAGAPRGADRGREPDAGAARHGDADAGRPGPDGQAGAPAGACRSSRRARPSRRRPGC